MQTISYPVCQISERGLVIYDEYVSGKGRTVKAIENEINLRDITYNGFMSKKTKSKVSKMLGNWINAVRYGNNSKKYKNDKNKPYVTFLTLTLSGQQVHTDNEIKRLMLNRFLLQLKQISNYKNYFWRAEAQKNGNIHFHVILDSFIPKIIVSDLWNQIQYDNGYLDKFIQKFGHRNPPSTLIHKLSHINNTEAYLVKYCCKSEGYRTIKGRVWGCSDAIRCIKACTILLEGELRESLERLEESKEVKVFADERFVFYRMNAVKYLKKHFKVLYREYESHLLQIYKNLYHATTQPICDVIEENQDFINEFGSEKVSLLGVQLNMF